MSASARQSRWVLGPSLGGRGGSVGGWEPHNRQRSAHEGVRAGAVLNWRQIRGSHSNFLTLSDFLMLGITGASSLGDCAVVLNETPHEETPP